jgi:hypothetical protein
MSKVLETSLAYIVLGKGNNVFPINLSEEEKKLAIKMLKVLLGKD